GRVRGFRLAALAYQCGDLARLAVAQQADFHFITDVQHADGIAQFTAVFHGDAVERGDDVAGLDAGALGRRTLCYTGHQRARRFAEAEFLRNVGSDVIKLDAENSALDLPVFDELVHDVLDHVDRDREADADVAAGCRQDGGVDADQLAAQV